MAKIYVTVYKIKLGFVFNEKYLILKSSVIIVLFEKKKFVYKRNLKVYLLYNKHNLQRVF